MEDVWFETEAVVIKGLPNNFILGVNFLRKYEAILNLKENTVRIDNREIYLAQKDITTRNIDQDIISKLMTIQEADLREIIKESKMRTPVLETIKNTQHSIELLRTPYNSKKISYSLPYAAKNALRLEISRLINLNIMRSTTAMFPYSEKRREI